MVPVVVLIAHKKKMWAMQNNFFFWAMVLVLSARFELANRCDYRYRRVER